MTFQKFGLLCGACAALLTPAAALAQAPGGAQSSQPFALAQPAPSAPTGAGARVDVDARCLASAMIMSSVNNAQIKAMGPPAQFYFFGRIEGHGGRGNLNARIAAQFEAFKATPQIVGPSIQTCAQIFATRSNAYGALLADMQKRFGKSGEPTSGAPAH